MRATELLDTFGKARESVIDAMTQYVKDKGGEVELRCSADPYYRVESEGMIFAECFKKLSIKDGVCYIQYTIGEGWESFEEEETTEELGVWLTLDELYFIIMRLEDWRYDK